MQAVSATHCHIERPAVIGVLRTDRTVYFCGHSYHLLSVSGSAFSTSCSMSGHMVDLCTSWFSRAWERHEWGDILHISAKHYWCKTMQSFSTATLAGRIPECVVSVGLIPTLQTTMRWKGHPSQPSGNTQVGKENFVLSSWDLDIVFMMWTRKLNWWMDILFHSNSPKM